MPAPTLVFGFILATLLGAVFHLIMGGDVRRLALFLLAGWIGFAIGQLIGVIADIDLLRVGTLRAFSAGLGAIITLILTHFLTYDRGNSKRVSR
ncbi:MAG: hypothetical protein JNM70_08675 [Anaerolineae bacterium]|nr:hypothetical protein [Anaerolineae bacterium]